MAGHMPMRHISREELYTDIESRVRYLHSFLDFGSDDIEALIYASKYVKILIPAVVNIVYKKLLQYDITARAFTTRSTSFEGPLDTTPTENSPQMLHRKAFLRAYLNKLCSDPSRLEYWKYCNKVGLMHVGLGREHPLHVEYIHLGATMALIQEVMTEAILSHPRLSMTRKIAIVKALGKVIWIQNDFMAKWHVRDGDEFQQKAAGEGGRDHPAVEPEGYLDGKKVLEDDDSEDSPAARKSGLPRPTSGSSPGGVCPFSGMSRDIQDPVASVPNEDRTNPVVKVEGDVSATATKA
ncbi:Protoglobin-domain-containing protein [Microdochium bolleyi]|uniref:Protoglobin-domain-containing protein n=1 Tax=Microdochium bolleyi TaxID=196109 RepID=A0A136J034_9PEZI|nr:Protoglobin-domain-containing protein [Microdochium bolleyi]